MCFINFCILAKGGVMNTNKVILKPLFQKQTDPLTLLLKDIFKDNRNAMSYLGALSIGLGFSQADSVFADDDVEEVVELEQLKALFQSLTVFCIGS